MTRNLAISSDLKLPIDTVTGTIVVYGNRGMGKTNFGSVLAEELSKNRLHFSIIDPMGAWYGLQSSKDGKGPGIPVLLLGGLRGDLPIEPTAGAVVADLVVDERVSTVIDISRHANGKAWHVAEKIRFVTEYTYRLYERQVERSRPLLQIYDEAARYAPQTFPTGAKDIATCLGAISQLVEEGRNIGVGTVLLTQRSARMAKSVSELAECMIAFRTIGPNSVGAVTDWLGEYVEKSRIKDMTHTLRSLPVGSALVVSPGWLNFEGVVRFRERETFDSSKTPKPGERRLEPVNPAKPDLTKYRELMAETVERAIENDPKTWKQRVNEANDTIRKLRADLERVQSTPAVQPCDHEPLIRELYARLERADKIRRSELTSLWDQLDRVSDAAVPNRHQIDSFFESIGEGPTQLKPALPKLSDLFTGRKEIMRRGGPGGGKTQEMLAVYGRGATKGELVSYEPPAASAKTIPVFATTPIESNGDGGTSARNAPEKILQVLAQHGPCAKDKLSMLSGYPWNGSFRTNLSTLRKLEYITGGNTEIMSITPAGRQHLSSLGIDTVLPTGAKLRDWWLRRVGRDAAPGKILKALFDVYPEGLTKDEICERTGYPWNGSLRTNLSTLRRAGVMQGKNTETMFANKELFCESGS